MNRFQHHRYEADIIGIDDDYTGQFSSLLNAIGFWCRMTAPVDHKITMACGATIAESLPSEHHAPT